MNVSPVSTPDSSPFELRRAEAERVVAGDVGEQVAGRIAALELDVAVAGRLHATGDDDAVGGDDRPARRVELADQRPGVAGLGRELLGPVDLPVVERREQHHVQRDQHRGQLADLPVHGCVLTP